MTDNAALSFAIAIVMHLLFDENQTGRTVASFGDCLLKTEVRWKLQSEADV